MLTSFDPEDNKNRKSIRKIFVRPIEGEKALATSGLVDSRLFKGESHFLGIRDPQFNLWKIQYSDPRTKLPKALNQRFTSFPQLFNYLTIYLKKRNIEIFKVED